MPGDFHPTFETVDKKPHKFPIFLLKNKQKLPILATQLGIGMQN